MQLYSFFPEQSDYRLRFTFYDVGFINGIAFFFIGQTIRPSPVPNPTSIRLAMKQEEFVDYYEVLEVSSNANTETVEKIFRYLASRNHPDVCGAGNKARFNQMVEAYNVLRDPATRAKYDAVYHKQQAVNADLLSVSEATGDDCVDRFRLLSLFYAQRRQDMKNPGIGIMKLAQIMCCPMEVLEFHVWYFREKGWISREESGLLSITSAGVDEIEERNRNIIPDDRLITYQPPTGPGEPSLIITPVEAIPEKPQARPPKKPAASPRVNRAASPPVQAPVQQQPTPQVGPSH